MSLPDYSDYSDDSDALDYTDFSDDTSNGDMWLAVFGFSVTLLIGMSGIVFGLVCWFSRS